uniref:Uncharacterized protein n=1 Tax=Rhizophora mucronata TaxID=61149 RepID=A0A2P2QLU8_RHIMU
MMSPLILQLQAGSQGEKLPFLFLTVIPQILSLPTYLRCLWKRIWRTSLLCIMIPWL